jgi:hypothetical protein
VGGSLMLGTGRQGRVHPLTPFSQGTFVPVRVAFPPNSGAREQTTGTAARRERGAGTGVKSG